MERMARMVGQSDVVDVGDRWLRTEPLGDLHGVLRLALDTDAERLDAAQQQPRVNRREVRPLRLDVELEVLAVVGVSVGNGDDARDDVVVAADVLRRAVDDDVGAERQGFLEVRREEGVVDGEQGAVLVGELGERADVADEHHRVRRRLDEDHLRLRADFRGRCLEVGRVDVVVGQAVLLVDVVDESDGAAVEVFGEQDVVAGIQQVEHHVDGSHARRDGPGALAALELREDVLELLARRIGDAAVVEARALLVAGMAVGGREVDRLADGTGGIVGVTAVHFKGIIVQIFHEVPPDVFSSCSKILGRHIVLLCI